ncbi:MAG: hypothetical protein PHY15_04405, partial [Eubacteriales bacterium]|nr:hypothetical protein [Eubacteriales bacterium]
MAVLRRIRMNRVILLVDTGRSAVYEAADWFLKQEDCVYLAVRSLPKNSKAGCHYLVFDPTQPESLSAAVETLQKEAGKLDIFIAGAWAHPTDGEIGTGHDYDEML